MNNDQTHMVTHDNATVDHSSAARVVCSSDRSRNHVHSISLSCNKSLSHFNEESAFRIHSKIHPTINSLASNRVVTSVDDSTDSLVALVMKSSRQLALSFG